MKFAAKKFINLIITILLISLVTFLAFNLIPGDPAQIMLGINASPESVEALREELGLNKPLGERYISWVSDLFRGDLGESILYKMPVAELISGRLAVTFWLAILALVIIAAASLPLSLLAARFRNKFADGAIRIFSQISMSVPNFFLGMLLTLVFGLIFKWIRIGQDPTDASSFAGFIGCLVVPAISIAIPKIGNMVSFMRNSIVDELNKDYVRTAYSKGCSHRRVLYGHVLRNALIPVITMAGTVAAEVLAGVIVIEQVFGLPGIGRLLIASISARDFPLIQAIVIYIATIVVIVNFAVDILYKVIDPRIRRA